MRNGIFLLSTFFFCNLFMLYAKVGDKAPANFILPDLHKKEYIFLKERIEGKKVILNFFATYCEPCKEEIPEIQKLVLDYPEVKLIFISIDESSEISKLEWVAKDWNIENLVLLDSYQIAIHQYAKSKLAIPATFILDAKGKIQFESVGYDKNTITKIRNVLDKLGDK